jgi:hypothetical protein
MSGYVDDELTQQQRQLVDVHLEQCKECSNALTDLEALRERVGAARLKSLDDKVWRETTDDSLIQASAGMGWLILIGGFLLVVGYGVFEFITDPDIATFEKMAASVVYLGFGGLFFSVLRQRLIEWRTDRYKDVEI